MTGHTSKKQKMPTFTSMTAEQIKALAKQKLADCSTVVVFDGKAGCVYTTGSVDSSELLLMPRLLQDRDEAVKTGVKFRGRRYEIHRHHPPVIYGRTMDGVVEDSEGFAFMQLLDAPSNELYAFITYEMPHVSARMVPQLQEFAKQLPQRTPSK